MLPWQRKNRMLSQQPLKLLGISTGAHVVVLILIFFIANRTATRIITISSRALNDNIPVIFMPLCKTIAPTNKPIGLPASPKKINKPIIKPLIKSPVKPVIKSEAKKIYPVSPLPVQKKQVKKLEPKKIIKPVTPEPIKEPVKEPVVEEFIPGQPLCIGREDLALLEIERTIMSEIQKYWQTPVGLAPNLVCLLKVIIASTGTVNTIIIEQSSKVLIFDMAARTAALKAQYPKPTWGKEMLLQFGGDTRETIS